MIVLDCESRESALASVAAIYCVSPIAIESFLHTLDLGAHYEKNDPPHSYDKELRLLFESSFGCDPAPIDRVCWFHLTRAHLRSDFSNGIQPLSVSLDLVWKTILEVFRGTKHERPLVNMRRDGVANYLYGLKANDPFHAGPYAMLVRAVATNPHGEENHFLQLPEIMEDICNGYEKVSGESLHAALTQELTPMIVKFWGMMDCELGCIEAALFYLYLTAHNHLSFDVANIGFDGENKAIPPEQILQVEVLE